MNAPAPSRRRFGVLFIWCGSVATVLAGAFALAWWKLPEWQPRWVIEHSPWVEPAVRAMIAVDVRDNGYFDVRDRIMEWGSAIGPPLRWHYDTGSHDVREQVLILAAATLYADRNGGFYVGGGFSLFREPPRTDPPELQPDRVFRPRQDGRRLSPSEEVALLADLRWLAITASKESSDILRALSLPLIAAVRDPGLMQVPSDWLLSGTSGIDADVLIEAVEEIRDPRSVPRLIPLLSTTPESAARKKLAFALHQCLAMTQVAEVVGAARHQDRYVREWAASVIDRVRADPVLEECLFELLSDPEEDVRLTAFTTLIRRRLPVAFHASVIRLLADPTQEIRRMAVEAIIDLEAPVPLRAAFLERLADPEPNLRLMVIDAIGKQRIREGGEPLLVRLAVEPELSLRMSIIEAIGRLEHIDAKPVLRQIAQLPEDPLQGAAIVALGTLRDPTDYPLLLNLLSHDDDDIARKARIGLEYLTLTPGQQKIVDALWEARSYDDAPSAPPAPTPVPTPAPTTSFPP